MAARVSLDKTNYSRFRMAAPTPPNSTFSADIDECARVGKMECGPNKDELCPELCSSTTSLTPLPKITAHIDRHPSNLFSLLCTTHRTSGGSSCHNTMGSYFCKPLFVSMSLVGSAAGGNPILLSTTAGGDTLRLTLGFDTVGRRKSEGGDAAGWGGGGGVGCSLGRFVFCWRQSREGEPLTLP